MVRMKPPPRQPNMIPTNERTTLHTVAMYCDTLCIRCRQCNHRGAIQEPGLPIRPGNTTLVKDLPLRCRKCGSRDVETLIPAEITDAVTWLDQKR